VKAELPENAFLAESRAAWRNWLAKHHGRAEGVWLATYKKKSGKPQLDYNEAVEEALCFGWVDSKAQGLDEERTMLWMAPRKPRSNWSRSNKERAARLTADGLMQAAGLAKIDAAKKNGSWTALDEVEDTKVPRDLEAALKAHPPAAENFEAFPPGVKRSILGWIANAKRAETRSRRVEETALLAQKNVRANQGEKQKVV
jgi:uncharacterized protein YdeI (YjbR/CyaY-like superfamily)